MHLSCYHAEQNNRYYIVNGTTTELGYHFNSDIIPGPALGNVHITVTVTAVSKCSQQGLRSSAVEWREDTDRPMFTSGPNTVKTDKNPTVLKEYYMINGNVTPIINLKPNMIKIIIITICVL